jgi:uncharacterized damage-inducible protein DinB
MSIAQSFLGDWDQEMQNTSKMLAAVPDGHADWKPSEKSMPLGRLAGHVAELADWAGVTMNFPELDFAKFEYKPPVYTTAADNVAKFEVKAKAAREIIANASDAAYMEPWTMRNGAQVFFTMPKVAVMRNFVFNHMIHHRAQLVVYLRMLGAKVPGMYGPSADEGM